jgi:hypothetical protein
LDVPEVPADERHRALQCPLKQRFGVPETVQVLGLGAHAPGRPRLVKHQAQARRELFGASGLAAHLVRPKDLGCAGLTRDNALEPHPDPGATGAKRIGC